MRRIALLVLVLLATTVLSLGGAPLAPQAEARSAGQVDRSCLKRSDYYRGQRGGGCRAAFGRSGVAYDVCMLRHRLMGECASGLESCLAKVGTAGGLFTSCSVCKVRYQGCMQDSRDLARDLYFKR